MATEQIKLVSSFARFVQGDIKGGAHAHAYRVEVMTTAIEQAFKGNYSPITEALTLTEGKAKKARAYAAGFAALGPIGSTNSDGHGVVKVEYVGKLTAHENKAARDAIDSRTAHFTSLFFGAFDAVIAEKAEAKPKKAAAPVADTGAAAGTVADADTVRHDAAVALDNSVASIETMLRSGALTGEQTDRISAALIACLNSEQLVELVSMVSATMDQRLAAAEAVSLASAGAIVAEAAHA